MEDIAGIAPLTPVQSGMVFHTLREPSHGVYVVQYTCVLSGRVDVPRLKEAWASVVAMHPALRTVFLFEGLDEPLQVVRRQVDVPWTELDWRKEDAGSVPDRLSAYLTEDRLRGFELARAPLLRLALLRFSDERTQFVWTYHHAIADGWSSVLVLDEVWRRYRSNTDTSNPSLEPAFTQFPLWLKGRSTAELEAYWTDRLVDVDLPTGLAFAPPRGAASLHERKTLVLDRETSDALRRFATRHRLTLSSVVHGAWGLVLSACSGHANVVYGATVAGRPSAFPDADKIVGPFITTLPVRADTSTQASTVTWLRSLQAQLLEVREHELAAVSDIARWNGIDGAELFETLLVFENAPASSQKDGPATDSDVHVHIQDEEYFDQSSYAFAALVHPKDSLELHAVYRQDYLDGRDAEAILELLAETLERLHTAEETPVSSLVSASSEQTAALLGRFAAAPMEDTCPVSAQEPADVFAAILAQAERTPDAPAVVTLEREWSYNELMREVFRLKSLLRESGTEAGDRVGLLAPKSYEFLAGLLATLAMDASYVPLDPANPNTRLASMVATARVQTVLTLDVTPDRLTALGFDPAHTIPLSPDSTSPPPDDLFAAPWTPEDDDEQAAFGTREAYILFTSGSTGAPKGVRISRANLAHSTAARTLVYGATPARFLVLSPIGFDSSVAGLTWPLTVGGAVVLAPSCDERDPLALGQVIAQLDVTTTLCIPSLYRLVLDGARASDLATLKTVIVAGEACPREVVHNHQRLLPQTALVNEYGPTECTVWSTFARLDVPDLEGPVPIGRPIPGAVVRVLDGQGRLAPLGVAGELCIGGAGVALGYVGDADPDESRDGRFVTDRHGFAGSRVYRTGDRVRMDLEGTLHFLGRVDEQLKIRGFRIEPGEVEAALCTLADVSEAVVVAENQAESDHSHLVSYYATHDGNPIDPATVRAHVDSLLPSHMVPTMYCHVERIPRTGRGKVDKNSLPAPSSHPTPGPRHSSGAEGPSPRTEVGQQLETVWAQLLGGPGFHGSDSFFEVGGDSLLAIRLLGQIRKRWDTQATMAALFDNPTLDGMAAYIEAVLWARDSINDAGAGDKAVEELEF